VELRQIHPLQHLARLPHLPLRPSRAPELFMLIRPARRIVTPFFLSLSVLSQGEIWFVIKTELEPLALILFALITNSTIIKL
jgi:hypothetical protein